MTKQQGDIIELKLTFMDVVIPIRCPAVNKPKLEKAAEKVNQKLVELSKRNPKAEPFKLSLMAALHLAFEGVVKNRELEIISTQLSDLYSNMLTLQKQSVQVGKQTKDVNTNESESPTLSLSEASETEASETDISNESEDVSSANSATNQPAANQSATNQSATTSANSSSSPPIFQRPKLQPVFTPSKRAPSPSVNTTVSATAKPIPATTAPTTQPSNAVSGSQYGQMFSKKQQ